MKQFFAYILKWLLYGNVLIAFCAVSFTLEAYYLLNLTPQFDYLVLMNGLAAFFTYLFIRVVGISRIKNYAPYPRWEFFLKNIFWMRLLTGLSLLATGIVFFLLPYNVQRAFIVPGILSILYGISFKYKGRLIKLRDIGLLKIFLIAFVWAYIGSVLPVINSGGNPQTTACLSLFWAHFLFAFAVTLPFDRKDLEIDKMNNVKTIPAVIGVEKMYLLCYGLLICSLVIHGYLQLAVLHNNFRSFLPLIISISATIFIIFLTKKRDDKFLYFGLLDGMLILQFILVWLFAL